VLRFINNCRKKKEERLQGSLSIEEFKEVDFQIIKIIQKTMFSDEYTTFLEGQQISRKSSKSIDMFVPQIKTSLLKGFDFLLTKFTMSITFSFELSLSY